MNNLKIILPLLVVAIIFIARDKTVTLKIKEGQFNNEEEIKEFTKLWQLVYLDYSKAEEINGALMSSCSYTLDSYLDEATKSKLIPFKKITLEDTFTLTSSTGIYLQNEEILDTLLHVDIEAHCNQLKFGSFNTWLIKDIFYKVKHLSDVELEVDYCPTYRYYSDYKKKYPVNNIFYSDCKIRIKERKEHKTKVFTIRQELHNEIDSLVLHQDFCVDLRTKKEDIDFLKEFYEVEGDIIVKANKSHFKNEKTKMSYKELVE